MTTESTPAKARLNDVLGHGAEAPPLLERLRQRWPDTPHHRDGLHIEAAAEIERQVAVADSRVAAERERCAQSLRDAAEMLAPEGRRTNQADRHTARVLATKGDELAAGFAVRPNG